MNKLATLWLFAIACGGGGGADSGALTAPQAEAVCEQRCAYQVSCGREDDVESCTPRCVVDLVGWMRADAAAALADCLVSQPCTEDDDQCLFEGVGPLAIHQAWEDACRSQLVGCVDPMLLEGMCEVTPDRANNAPALFRFIAPEIMTELVACLDGADCTARLTCVEDTIEAHGIDF